MIFEGTLIHFLHTPFSVYFRMVVDFSANERDPSPEAEARKNPLKAFEPNGAMEKAIAAPEPHIVVLPGYELGILLGLGDCNCGSLRELISV